MKSLLRDAPRAKEVEVKSWGLTVRDQTRISALEARREDQAGVVVDSVRNGGPSAEAKPALRPGDIITKFNGATVPDVKALTGQTEEFTKGATEPKPALVTFEHGREQYVTVVKIGPQPEEQKARQPQKAWLGASVQVVSPELATALGIAGKKGLRVTAVAPGSAAEKGGLKAGDLLLKLDGQVINASRPEDQEVLSNLIRAYDVGAEVEFDAIRDGAAMKLKATLGSRPKDDVEIPQFKDERFEFSARDLSESQRTNSQLEADIKGVHVSAVVANGWAALAGLRDDDILLSIDGESIPDIAALKKKLALVTNAKPRQTVFFVRRGIRSFYIEVEPQW
jgi:serine protease Do